MAFDRPIEADLADDHGEGLLSSILRATVWLLGGDQSQQNEKHNGLEKAVVTSADDDGGESEDDDDDDDDMNKNSSTRLFSRRPQSIFRSSGIKRSYECLSDAEGSCSSPGVSRANPISCSEDSSEGIYSSPQRCISLSTSTKRPRHGRASCPSPLFVTDSLSYRLSCGGRGRMFSFSSEDLRHPLAFDPSVASSDVFSKSD
mmetsp:Transcript_15441/g.30797  ORF Transcript_15441/g.30797 Transcript_15441/m.30797 type:complete len:202 (-) Transcript_15441:50-655(-)